MTVRTNPARSHPERAGHRELRRQLLELAGVGPWLPLTREEVVGAVPQGSRRALSQSDYLRACIAEPELADVRADRQRSLLEFARIHARYASWSDRSTRPTRARVCREAGWKSVTTYKQCRRWWEQRGYLATVRAGYSPHLRPGALADHDDPNEAAVYVLCVPQKKRATPRLDRPTPRKCPLTVNPADASTTREGQTRQSSTQGRALPRPAHFRRHADVLRKGPGQTISDARASWMARVFARAGWSPSDLAFAIAHHPTDGRYQSSLSDVTKPGALLFWRLSRWLDDPERAWQHYVATGQLAPGLHPVPSAGQRARQLAERDRARREQLAAERAEREQRASSPSAAWHAARATLHARRKDRQNG